MQLKLKVKMENAFLFIHKMTYPKTEKYRKLIVCRGNKYMYMYIIND